MFQTSYIRHTLGVISIETKKKQVQLLVKIRDIVIFLLYLTLFYFIPPIIFGLFFAYLLFPIFLYFKRILHIPFFIVVIVLSILLFTVISAVIILILHSLFTLLPSLQTTVHLLEKNYDAHPLFPLILDKFSGLLNELMFFMVDFIKNSLHSIFELLIFIVTFYFALFESNRNRLWFFAYIPAMYRTNWSRYFQKAMQLISFFLLVEIQLFTLTFILLSIGFYFLQFEAFFMKAFLIAFADSLPFLGIGIFLIPISIYFFIVGQPIVATLIIVLYIFVQIVRQLTESMLWSHTFHLRMIHTFIISAASVLLFGIYGIILSPLFLMMAIKFKQHPIFVR